MLLTIITKYFEKNLDNDIINWKAVYTLPRCATISSRLRVFQYKILDNILYLDNTLFKMKVVQNPKCSICESNAETITHLFVECQFVSCLWTNVVNWCGKEIGLPPRLTLEHCYLGIIYSDSSFDTLTNLLIILLKHLIYVLRENKTRLSLKSFIKYVCETEQLGRIITFKDESHFTKWDKLIPLLE